MSAVKVAVAQFNPELEPTANLSRIAALVAEAVLGGATLVVLPEYSSSFNPRLDEEVLKRAQPLDGEFVQAIGELARKHSVKIVFGLVATTTDPRKFANMAVAVGEHGDVTASYSKAHLFDAFGHKESDRVLAGDLAHPAVFEHEGFTVGLQTCYDIRFPEVSRWLIDAGATMLIVPAEWVNGEHKLNHWRTLLTARAIENTVYVVAADHPEPIGVGSSMVITPLGEVCAQLDGAAGVVLADVDPAAVQSAREVNPSITLRRFAVTVK